MADFGVALQLSEDTARPLTKRLNTQAPPETQCKARERPHLNLGWLLQEDCWICRREDDLEFGACTECR